MSAPEDYQFKPNQPAEAVVRDALHAADPVAALEPLFAEGLDANYLLGYHGTLLFRAAYERDVKLAKYILQKGADANFSVVSNSPLNACCMRSRSEDADEARRQDDSALEIATLLLDAGADADRCDALWHAAVYCNARFARLVLEHHNNNSSSNSNSSSSEERGGALAKKSLNRFETADMAKARDVDFGLGTPLHRLARLERYEDEDETVDFARALVENGADVHLKDEKGRTALELAKAEENEAVAQYLKGLGR